MVYTKMNKERFKKSSRNVAKGNYKEINEI